MFCMGIAPPLCTNDNFIDQETGLTKVASIGFALTDEFWQHPSWWMLLPRMALLMILVPLRLLELLMGGPGLAPTVLLAIVVAFKLSSSHKRGFGGHKRMIK